MVESQRKWVAAEHSQTTRKPESRMFLSWQMRLCRKCQETLDLIQQVGRTRAPVEYLCCSVSSGCVSNVWQLFATTLALWWIDSSRRPVAVVSLESAHCRLIDASLTNRSIFLYVGREIQAGWWCPQYSSGLRAHECAQHFNATQHWKEALRCDKIAWWMAMCSRSVSMKKSSLLSLNVLGQRQRRRLPTESLKRTALERWVKVKQFSAVQSGAGAPSARSINGEWSRWVLQWCRGWQAGRHLAGGGETLCLQLSPRSSMHVCMYGKKRVRAEKLAEPERGETLQHFLFSGA